MDKPKPWDLDTCFEIYKSLYDEYGTVVFHEKWLKDNNHKYLYYRFKKLGSNIELFCKKYNLIEERDKSKNIIKNVVNNITTNIDIETKFADIKILFQNFLDTNDIDDDDLILLQKCQNQSEQETDLNKRENLKNILFGFKMIKRYPKAVWFYDDNNILDYTKVIIPEFPAYYANIYGDIYSKRNNKKHSNKISNLYNKNGKINTRIHQIICQVFYGEKPSEIHTVDHINIDHNDNRPYNLRWATPSEQALNKDKSNFGIGAQKKIIRTNISTNISQIFDTVVLAMNGINHTFNSDELAARSIIRYIKKNVCSFFGYTFAWWIPDDIGNLLPILVDEVFTKDGWYVSDTGWIKTSQNVYTKGTDDRYGYKKIKADGKSFKVHQLVFKTFKPDLYKPYPLYVINHKNGIKNDNNLENLECITPRENTKHAFDTGLIKNISKKIIQLSLSGEKIAIFDNAILAGKAVSNAEHACKSIRSCCKGEKQKSAYGFCWKYET
jgi:hypothetical protein